MLIEATLLGLAVLTWKKLGKKEEWTDKREEMYQSALEHLKGPAGIARLREIADECDKHGFFAKAYALRKRADLRAASEKVKQARHEAYKKGMRSFNVEGIRKLAQEFVNISATGAAKDLRERADGIERGEITPESEARARTQAQAQTAEPQPQAHPQVEAQVVEEPKTAAATPQAKAAAAEVVPDLPDAAAQTSEAKADIPPVAPRKVHSKPRGFDTRQQAIDAINGKNGSHETVVSDGGEDQSAGA